jgi:hypothetical protein
MGACILPAEHPVVLRVGYIKTDRPFATIDGKAGRRRHLYAFEAIRTVHP